jgi:hypothetical protein
MSVTVVPAVFGMCTNATRGPASRPSTLEPALR